MIDLLIMGLATHEAIALWFSGSLFIRFRARVSRVHPLVHEGVNCPICMSVWIGAAVYLAWSLAPWAVWILAIIDVAALLNVPNQFLQRPQYVGER